MWFPIHPQGSRVCIQRGARPMDPNLPGRVGMVIHTDLQRPGRYGVILDGEDRVRTFHEDEVQGEEAATDPQKLPSESAASES